MKPIWTIVVTLDMDYGMNIGKRLKLLHLHIKFRVGLYAIQNINIIRTRTMLTGKANTA